MRVGLLVPCLIASLALSFPRSAEGQFQELSKQELQLTLDPKGPGVDAVYLYREQSTDDRTHLKTIYARSKVFTEKGKEELSVVSSLYVYGITQVLTVKARTVHADGAIIPMTEEPADLVEIRVGKLQVNKLVITFPSVEVGSILEYRMEFRNAKDLDSEPLWDLQQAYPVMRAHYSFHPARRANETYKGETVLHYSWSLPPKSAVNYDVKSNAYTLDLADVPPLPKEDWMPPLNTLKYKVEFYHVDFESRNDSTRGYWYRAASDWTVAIDEVTKPTSELKRAAERIVAVSDSAEEKARKLYEAVQRLDNTDFERAKSKAELKREHKKEIRSVTDVWKQRRGNRDEIALLFVSLANALNLPVNAGYVVDRSRAIFDEHHLSMDQMDDFIAVLHVNGRDVYLDPGEKMCPFGLLHWKHTMSYGFRRGQFNISTTPEARSSDSVKQRIAEVQLDRSGSAKGTVRFVMTGNVALYWRQLALKNDVEELKKQFKEATCDSFPPGTICEVEALQGLGDPASNLTITVSISGMIGTPTGKRLFVQALLFRSKEDKPFLSSDNRVTPIDVHFPLTEEDRITFHLPKGFEVETLPVSAHFDWRDRARLETTFSFPPETVNASRTLSYGYTILPAAVYRELQSFYRKVATADEEQLVLSPSQSE